MNGILYFSSTGNSLYIAKKVKEKFNGSIIYIPSYTGDGSEFQKIFIVTPIYSFGMPTFVLDLLNKLNKSTEIFVIQNYGGMVGGADRLFYNYAVNKFNLNVKAIYKLKMPENFTLVMSPPKFYTKLILNSARKRINKVLNKIINKEYSLPKNKKTKEKTYLKNKSNWHLIGERFSTNSKCVKCGKCVAICPVNNIVLKNNKIEFLDKCVACLGCFHRCPTHAIIYKNKDNKKRYVNPLIDEHEIGKNL